MWEASTDLFRLNVHKDLNQKDRGKFHKMSQSRVQRLRLREIWIPAPAAAGLVYACFLSLSGSLF
jgi:hypothetical protein